MAYLSVTNTNGTTRINSSRTAIPSAKRKIPTSLQPVSQIPASAEPYAVREELVGSPTQEQLVKDAS